VSLGLVDITKYTEGIAELLKYADVASYKAKGLGETVFISMTWTIRRLLDIAQRQVNQIHNALEKSHFILMHN